jgi:hypothetical protein
MMAAAAAAAGAADQGGRLQLDERYWRRPRLKDYVQQP